MHVGGDHFHSHVDIIHACDRARIEAEAKARQENEVRELVGFASRTLLKRREIEPCWFIQDKNKYVTFEIVHGETKFGESYYVVGNVPELGDWDIARALKMECKDYPTWRAEHVLLHDKWGHKACAWLEARPS